MMENWERANALSVLIELKTIRKEDTSKKKPYNQNKYLFKNFLYWKMKKFSRIQF